MTSFCKSTLLLFLATLVQNSSALAEDSCSILFVERKVETFEASAKWNAKGRKSFTNLELAGIEFNAFENAVSQARIAGKQHIAYGIVSTGFSKSEGLSRETELRARVLSFDDHDLQGGQVVTGSTTWNGNDAFSDLEIMGIRHEALTDAIKNCFSAGYQICIYQGSTLSRTNQQVSGRYHTDASALVVGYSRSQNFSHSVEWHTGGDFTELQTAGIKFNAFEKTVFHAQSQGHLNVAFGIIDQDKAHTISGTRYVTKTAVVISTQGLDLVEGPTFTGASEWNQSSRVDALSALGIRQNALENAIARCFDAGYSLCVYQGGQILKENFISNGRYYTQANAIVRGYNRRQ